MFGLRQIRLNPLLFFLFLFFRLFNVKRFAFLALALFLLFLSSPFFPLLLRNMEFTRRVFWPRVIGAMAPVAPLLFLVSLTSTRNARGSSLVLRIRFRVVRIFSLFVGDMVVVHSIRSRLTNGLSSGSWPNQHVLDFMLDSILPEDGKQLWIGLSSCMLMPSLNVRRIGFVLDPRLD